MLRPLLLLLALLPAALAGAGAGYYRIATSGGAVESTGPGGRYTGGYEHTPVGGTTGPGQSAQALGEVRTGGYAPPGTGPGGASCGGAVTASFVWVRDSPQDDPPSAVVVEKTASAYAAGDSPAADAGMDDSDLLDLGTTVFNVGRAYEVKGGASFEVTVEPSASASDPQYGTCGVSVIVSCTPVTLSVAGTTDDGDGNLLTLIGRFQQGSISAGGYELRNHNWSVSGPQLFASVQVTSISHSYEPFLGAHTDPTVSFYASKNGSETVGCACDVYLAGTNSKVGSINATQIVDVRKPSFNLVIGNVPGAYTGYVPDSANATEVNSGMTSQGLINGGASVAFGYTAVNDEGFPGDDGTVSLCRLVNESSNYSPDGPYQTDGAELDNSFPYNGHMFSVDENGTGPTAKSDGDRPSRGIVGLTEFTINVNYTTTEMYRPDGGVDVPLRTKNWTWNTAGAKVGTPGLWSPPSGGVTVMRGGGTDFDLISATWYDVEINQP